jgi:hypothetical protein
MIRNKDFPSGLYIANLYELYAAGRLGKGRGEGMVYFDMSCFHFHSLQEIIFDKTQGNLFRNFREAIQATQPWGRS